MKELKPIRNRAEYQAALLEASIYFDKPPELGTKKADRFEILLMLIEFETKRFKTNDWRAKSCLWSTLEKKTTYVVND